MLLDKARAAAADLLNAPLDSTVFVQNATIGVNTVFRNLKWAENGTDVIISFSTIYKACGKTADFVVDYFGGRVDHLEVELDYPLEDEEIIQNFRDAVGAAHAEGRRVKICIFDVVSATPGLVFPWQDMIQVCRELGILSMIDGAHSIGMVPVDLSAHEPDFFVTNCHKWLHVPRGCAVFFVPARNQHLLPSTLSTSHGYVSLTKKRSSPLPPSSKSKFVNNFEFVGTMDNSPYLCLPAALEWRRRLGSEEEIMAYLWELNKKGSRLIADHLKTEVLENKAGTLTNCAMANVALPVWIGDDTESDNARVVVPTDKSDGVLQWMTETLMRDYRTFLVVFIHRGQYWIRISAQVYLELEDYQWAASVLETLSRRVAQREYEMTSSGT